MAVDKAVMRQESHLRRTQLSETERLLRDQRRLVFLEEKLAELQPACVACYASCGLEPGTLDLLTALHHNQIEVMLPWTGLPPSPTPAWAWWDGGPLDKGWAGIPIPRSHSGSAELLNQAEVLIIPGLAGTRSGIRLGTGGGWYDRALLHARATSPRWMLLGREDVVENLPEDPWDQGVDAIVTDREWIDTH